MTPCAVVDSFVSSLAFLARLVAGRPDAAGKDALSLTVKLMPAVTAYTTYDFDAVDDRSCTR